jgi:DeoR/GlpR family transcriptional regulator of sugar metabolism
MDMEKSMYTIIRDSGVSHMTVLRALEELERSGKVQQITDVVGQVYPRWVRI